MNKKPKTPVFDPEAFGKTLRKFRRNADFSSADSFCEAVKEKTGVYIDKNTIHMIERGERDPDITKLIAMCFVISESISDTWESVLETLIEESLPLDFLFLGDEWEYHREYLAAYREEFKKDPDSEHIMQVFNPNVKAVEIPGTNEEKIFAKQYRDNSETFKDIKATFETLNE